MKVNQTYTLEITGAALSFLYYSSTCSTTSKEGFIVGSVEQRQTGFISDAADDGIKKETVIRITGIYPCIEPLMSFYYRNGQLNRDVLRKIQRQNEGYKIIGWFVSRRNSEFKPTFRETAIHSQLCTEFQKEHQQAFVFALVQSAMNANTLIREFQTKFFQRIDRGWMVLPGSVLNISKNVAGPNQVMYQMMPTIEPQLLSMLSKKANRAGRSSDRDHVENIVHGASAYIRNSLESICKLSCDIEKIEEEIRALEEQGCAQMEDMDEERPDHSPDKLVPEFPVSPVISRRNKSVEGPSSKSINSGDSYGSSEASAFGGVRPRESSSSQEY